MRVDLVIRYIGYGKRCAYCGLMRETTRYTVRAGEEVLSEYLLCDSCQDNGHIVSLDIPCKYERKVVGRKMDKRRRKRIIKISRKLEEGVARDIGGFVTPGSGNQDDKDDVRKFGQWRIEHKFTDSAKSYSMAVRTLDAVVEHANLTGERPALVLNFRKLAKRFVVLTYDTFLEVVEKLGG